MGKISISSKPSRAQAITVRNCNTAKFVHDRAKRELRQEVKQHIKAIWRCWLLAKRASIDYKLSKQQENSYGTE